MPVVEEVERRNRRRLRPPPSRHCPAPVPLRFVRSFDRTIVAAGALDTAAAAPETPAQGRRRRPRRRHPTAGDTDGRGCRSRCR